MSIAIEVDNVSKSFRHYRPDRPFTLQEVLARGVRGFRATERFWALRNVSFSADRGKAVGIIGTNGSGKSTLLRLVGGIGSVDSGRVRVAGRVGALLDLGSGLNTDLTGRENVIIAGVLNGLTRREVLRRFDAIVAFAEIEKFIDNPMRTYSSGMQMRLAFAVNVHTNPEVLLIDEVLAVGDAAFQRKCLARIAEFKANGCSILLVSHGLAAVQTLCDEVIWMNAGRLMAQGPVPDVVRQYEAHAGCSMEPELDDEPAAPIQTSVAAPADDGTTRDAHSRPAGPWHIAGVGLLDGNGHSLAEIRAGQGLRVSIDFQLTGVAARPCFRVKLVREDGLVCCEFATESSEHTRAVEPGRGRVTLVIDRLDLGVGHYGVDVQAKTYGGRFADDGQTPGCPLVVVADGEREAVMAVPHRWEFESAPRVAVAPD
jgi:lipopolysaccharide transport system ATP-binding protein